jgi:hypothetical protein
MYSAGASAAQAITALAGLFHRIENDYEIQDSSLDKFASGPATVGTSRH